MSRPKICVPITSDRWVQAAEVIQSVEPHEPDLIELRIDYMETLGGLEAIRGSTDLPLIATNRSVDQGGHFVGSEGERVSSLLKTCEAGFDYVDLELTTRDLGRVVDEVRGRGAKLIISYHDLVGTPSEQSLDSILEEEQSFRPDISKIVGNAESYHDNLTYINFLRSKPDVRLVCFAMGLLGTVSRVLSPLFGGAFTYASAEAGQESAPGQLTINTFREIYRLLGV